MSETELSRQIQDALAAVGLWCIRIQSGKARVKGGYMQCAPAGTPDLLVLSPFVFLECKLPTGKLSHEQECWHARARQCGVRVAVVRSVGDAMEAVRAAKAAA